MIKCLLCLREGHNWQRCPLFRSTQEYLEHMAPSPLSPEEMGAGPNGPSLAPNRLEEIFGSDSNPLLANALEDEDLSLEQKILSTEILIGIRKFRDMNPEEQELLNEVATHLAVSGGVKKPKKYTPPPRPAYVFNESEMTEDPLYQHRVGPDYYTSINYPDSGLPPRNS